VTMPLWVPCVPEGQFEPEWKKMIESRDVERTDFRLEGIWGGGHEEGVVIAAVGITRGYDVGQRGDRGPCSPSRGGGSNVIRRKQ
jgi:hypothetical protein